MTDADAVGVEALSSQIRDLAERVDQLAEQLADNRPGEAAAIARRVVAAPLSMSIQQNRVAGIAQSFRAWTAVTSAGVSTWLVSQGIDVEHTTIGGWSLSTVVAGGAIALGAVLIVCDTIRPIGRPIQQQGP